LNFNFKLPVLLATKLLIIWTQSAKLDIDDQKERKSAREKI